MGNFFRKRSALRARDDKVTNASDLTLRQSLLPLALVTILFFLWVNFHTFGIIIRVINAYRGLLMAFWMFSISTFRPR